MNRLNASAAAAVGTKRSGLALIGYAHVHLDLERAQRISQLIEQLGYSIKIGDLHLVLHIAIGRHENQGAVVLTCLQRSYPSVELLSGKLVLQPIKALMPNGPSHQMPPYDPFSWQRICSFDVRELRSILASKRKHLPCNRKHFRQVFWYRLQIQKLTSAVGHGEVAIRACGDVSNSLKNLWIVFRRSLYPR
jgi:hypothetical protein